MNNVSYRVLRGSRATLSEDAYDTDYCSKRRIDVYKTHMLGYVVYEEPTVERYPAGTMVVRKLKLKLLC